MASVLTWQGKQYEHFLVFLVCLFSCLCYPCINSSAMALCKKWLSAYQGKLLLKMAVPDKMDILYFLPFSNYELLMVAVIFLEGIMFLIFESPEDDPKYLKDPRTPSHSLWVEEQSILDQQEQNSSFPWCTAHTKLIPACKVSLLSHSCY